ncbi:hypothetical protein [uncultured Devosia sp.]|uniref:hypothetical protein n=1 Tax=uncultured Devosia sp. TaxID=211434 RepID=UPI00263183E8|nr:hypothetical protein [uncultured Devosia sp.]
MGDDINITDQDTLSADEQALLKQMENDDQGAGVNDEGGAPPPAPKKTPKKAPKAAQQQAQADEGQDDAEGDEGDAEGDAGAANKLVPLQALHESRATNRELKAELARQQQEHEQRMATAMDRFERALKAFAPKEEAPKEEPVPDFDADPAGHIQGVMKKTGKTLEEVLSYINEQKAQKQQAETQTAEQRKQAETINGILGYAIEQEKGFKAKTPDYDAASAYLIKSRTDELADLGYSDGQIQQIINTERLTIANQCMQSKKNPAEVVYNIAKKRGYKNAASDDDDQGQDQGEQRQVSQQKLEGMRGGREQSQSLSGARGNSPSPLTAQRLLEMSEAEFDKAIQTPEGRALLGA